MEIKFCKKCKRRQNCVFLKKGTNCMAKFWRWVEEDVKQGAKYRLGVENGLPYIKFEI